MLVVKFLQKTLTMAMVSMILVPAISYAQSPLPMDQADTTVKAKRTKNKALTVHVVADAGNAIAGNTEAAHLLVVVTNTNTGKPIEDLTKDDFSVTDHFLINGQNCHFTKQINDMEYAGNGAYKVKVLLGSNKSPCAWTAGEYLIQIAVEQGVRRGQAVTTLSIK